MELEHRFTVPAGLEETWAHFNDIEGVAGCFPGATVTEADGESFSGTVKVKLGPVALVYNGSGTFLEKDEAAHRLVIDAKGKDKRGNGTAGALVTAVMSDAGPGSTEVSVTTDLSITGKAAQFGRGNVIKDVSDKLLGQFVSCLEQQLVAGGTPDAPPEEESAPVLPPGGATTSATPVADAPEPAAAAAVPPAPPPVPSPASPSPADRPSDDSINLGATVLPVLARAYWKPAVGVLVALLVVIYLLVRD
jgi:carbon monoxide dehydrogenase subunit G